MLSNICRKAIRTFIPAGGDSPANELCKSGQLNSRGVGRALKKNQCPDVVAMATVLDGGFEGPTLNWIILIFSRFGTMLSDYIVFPNIENGWKAVSDR